MKRGISNHGFTLLEVLVAITILAIGLLGVASMQISAISGNRLGNELTAATFLAQAQIEACKGADLNSDILDVSIDHSDPNNPIDETGEKGGIFVRTWNVAENTAFSRTVTVTVSWPPGILARSVVLNTTTRGGGI
jgi:type IV pilus assembly protein PilV